MHGCCEDGLVSADPGGFLLCFLLYFLPLFRHHLKYAGDPDVLVLLLDGGREAGRTETGNGKDVSGITRSLLTADGTVPVLLQPTSWKQSKSVSGLG